MLANDHPRILFVSYTADWTGPTNSLLLLLKYLREQFAVAVLLKGSGIFSERLVEEGIPFYSLPSLDKWAIPAIYRIIRREKPALVYGNSAHSAARNALVAAKLARVPFVWHFREIVTGYPRQITACIPFASASVAVSQACADALQAYVKPEKIHVVYNGIETEVFTAERASARAYLHQETGLTDEHVVLIGVAHVAPRKGQLYALDALAQVVKTHPQTRLLLVGRIEQTDRAYVDRVFEQIKALGLSDQVHVLGFRKDVYPLLQGADIFLHTAVSDPHPRSVIEAMAAGLPVVAFAAHGVAETVVDQQTGYLHPPEDAAGIARSIIALADAPALRQTLGERGRQRVEAHFTAQATAQHVGEIIRQNLR